MAKLIYSTIASLDGYVADRDGNFEWGVPDEEEHLFVNDLERLEPAAVARMKAAATRDLAIGGPALAAEALRAGLVDECHLFLAPVVVGGGTPALPGDIHLGLELLDERRFGNGVVHLHYRVVG